MAHAEAAVAHGAGRAQSGVSAVTPPAPGLWQHSLVASVLPSCVSVQHCTGLASPLSAVVAVARGAPAGFGTVVLCPRSLPPRLFPCCVWGRAEPFSPSPPSLGLARVQRTMRRQLPLAPSLLQLRFGFGARPALLVPGTSPLCWPPAWHFPYPSPVPCPVCVLYVPQCVLCPYSMSLQHVPCPHSMSGVPVS